MEHLNFSILRLRRTEAAKLNRGMACPAKSKSCMEAGVVGEVDSHYDYRHRIYSLHMSYASEAAAISVGLVNKEIKSYSWSRVIRGCGW